MDKAVGSQRFLVKNVVRIAFKIGDAAARLGYNQVAGCNVPGTQVILPEAVKAATGYPA